MNDRQIIQMNGKLVVRSLEQIGEPATLSHLVQHISAQSDKTTDQITPVVQSVLRHGLAYGFVDRARSRYFLTSEAAPAGRTAAGRPMKRSSSGAARRRPRRAASHHAGTAAAKPAASGTEMPAKSSRSAAAGRRRRARAGKSAPATLRTARRRRRRARSAAPSASKPAQQRRRRRAASKAEPAEW